MTDFKALALLILIPILHQMNILFNISICIKISGGLTENDEY